MNLLTDSLFAISFSFSSAVVFSSLHSNGPPSVFSPGRPGIGALLIARSSIIA